MAGAGPRPRTARLAGGEAIATLTQLVYSSRPFGYDQSTLDGILLGARRCNRRDGITGALVCRHDLYLQMLEGPDDAVRAAYGRIRRDDRHVDVVLRTSAAVTDRMFAGWAMRHDPARSWLWSPEAVAEGILDREEAGAFLRVFQTVAASPRDEE